MSVRNKLIKEKLPKHVAVIMDGNGRWAKKKNKKRVFGHKNGVHSVREIVEASGELGVEYLTLYAFSTENWQRPKSEVDALISFDETFSQIRIFHQKILPMNLFQTIFPQQNIPILNY